MAEDKMLMDSYEIQEWAKDAGFDSAEFTLIVKDGAIVQGRFLDAYYGMVNIPELGDGFVRLQDLRKQLGNDRLNFIPHRSE